MHSRTHRAFACPHVGCEVNLTDKDDWAAHIGSPHHDLEGTGQVDKVQKWAGQFNAMEE